MGVPAGWYPEPDGSGGQRYFDGRDWTEHRAPQPAPWPPPIGAYPGYAPWGPAPWKGSQLGRPAEGPGALANPGRRLGARALDGLVLTPVWATATAIAIVLIVRHVGPLVRASQAQDQNAPVPASAFLWIYGAVFGVIVVSGLIQVAYETVATARYGRTLGKKWLHIRPVRTDGGPLGWGRALGRTTLYWFSNFLSWLGLLDPLWCLWDDNRQCVHDKIVGTIVVND